MRPYVKNAFQSSTFHETHNRSRTFRGTHASRSLHMASTNTTSSKVRLSPNWLRRNSNRHPLYRNLIQGNKNATHHKSQADGSCNLNTRRTAPNRTTKFIHLHHDPLRWISQFLTENDVRNLQCNS